MSNLSKLKIMDSWTKAFKQKNWLRLSRCTQQNRRNFEAWIAIER